MRWSWAYAPLVGIGAVAVANAVAITLWVGVRPEAVEDHPYLASAGFDARKAAGERFTALGMRFETAATPGALRVALTGGSVEDAELTLYRPDDRALDRVLAWTDPTQALSLPLRPGPWRLELRGRAGGEAVAAAVAVEIPPGTDG